MWIKYIDSGYLPIETIGLKIFKFTKLSKNSPCNILFELMIPIDKNKTIIPG